MIIAEKVVRIPGKRVRVTGTRKIAWKGEVSQAILTFEVAQITEGIYPSYNLDNISIQPDDDGDQLTNLQEKQIGSNPALCDSDNDGLAWLKSDIARWYTPVKKRTVQGSKATK